MKANELMIGNWVYLVKDYGRPKKDILKIDALDLHRISDGMLEVEPIPLTPEILENNGFIANKHVYPYPYYEYTNKEDKLKIGFAFPQGNRTSYKEPWVYIDSERIFIEHLPCIFVHQLQQALRLCEIEKEIILLYGSTKKIIHKSGEISGLERLLSFLDTLEVKEVDLMIHTIIAECCYWLAINTNIS